MYFISVLPPAELVRAYGGQPLSGMPSSPPISIHATYFLHKMYSYKVCTLKVCIPAEFCIRIETDERRDVWPVTLAPMESGTLHFAP